MIEIYIFIHLFVALPLPYVFSQSCHIPDVTMNHSDADDTLNKKKIKNLYFLPTFCTMVIWVHNIPSIFMGIIYVSVKLAEKKKFVLL